jgi:hypothetical protein
MVTAVAGYSGTPLAQKLGIKPGFSFALLHEPTPPVAALHGTLPTDVKPARTLGSDHNVILVFTTRAADLYAAWPALVAALHVDGGLWVAWPKKQSGVQTDITEDTIRNHALSHGLVDNKVCALDATWSGLRLVRRLKDRPKGSPRSRAAVTPARKKAR